MFEAAGPLAPPPPSPGNVKCGTNENRFNNSV